MVSKRNQQLHDTDARLPTEEMAEVNQEAREELRQERRQDRRKQREELDGLLPRAEAGTKERQIERKREKRESTRGFQEAAHGGGDMEFRDADIMGDGESGLSELKRKQAETQRRKNERELRREEIQRARAQERADLLAEHAEKEEKTMDMLRALARKNYG
jgi:hypothetical protein